MTYQISYRNIRKYYQYEKIKTSGHAFLNYRSRTRSICLPSNLLFCLVERRHRRANYCQI